MSNTNAHASAQAPEVAAAASSGQPQIDATPSSERGFQKGQPVLALYGGGRDGNEWYPGQISAVYMNGTYDVLYDDGDRETAVPSNCIRERSAEKPAPTTGSEPTPEPAPERAPETIGADGFTSREEGLLSAIRADGALESAEHAAANLPLHAEIVARWRGEDAWFTGRVAAIHGNGDYDILYDDNEIETNVPPTNVKSQQAEDVSSIIKFQAGTAVAALYKQESRWFPAVVEAIHDDGRSHSYDLIYDNGVRESYVPSRFVRILPQLPASSPRRAYRRVQWTQRRG